MTAITPHLPMLFAMLGIGAFAGVMAGLLGVGGGIILVPAFYYAFSALGYESSQLMQICLATSLATIVVTSVRSVLAHHRRGAVDWGILKSWAPGIVLGAVVGVLVASSLRSEILQLVFGFLALSVGAYMGLGRDHWRIANAMPGPGKRAILSPLLGFLSVLMGIGGGSFGVPLMALFNVPMHRAVATAAGFGLAIAAPSVIGFLMLEIATDNRPPYTLGAVNGVAFVLIISMTLLTAPLGVRLAHAMDARPLKRLFGVFLVLVALNMLRRVIGV